MLTRQSTAQHALPALQHDTRTLVSLQSYRVRLEDQLKALQSSKAEAAEQAAAAVALLIDEIAELEKVRAAEAADAAQLIEQLRADNALLTAASCRLHEQWKRDAAELADLKADVARREAAAQSQQLEAQQLLHRGAALAEERYRASERRRKIDVGVLAHELRGAEESRDELLVQQRQHTGRLLAEVSCLASEMSRAERECEAVAADGAAKLRDVHAQADADAVAHTAELRLLQTELSGDTAALGEVATALAEWEAAMQAERVHSLNACEQLVEACAQMEEEIDALPSHVAAAASTHALRLAAFGHAEVACDGGAGSEAGGCSTISSCGAHGNSVGTGGGSLGGKRRAGAASVSCLDMRPPWNHSTAPGRPQAARPSIPRHGSLLSAPRGDIELRFAAPPERLAGAGALVVPAVPAGAARARSLHAVTHSPPTMPRQVWAQPPSAEPPHTIPTR